MLKIGQQEKLYPPTNISVSLQCPPQLLLVKFENLVDNIFRNEYSTMEINVSHFEVLHWQQWQPPASDPNHGYLTNDYFSLSVRYIYMLWIF